jgi:hypothetical protein
LDWNADEDEDKDEEGEEMRVFNEKYVLVLCGGSSDNEQ